jgi:miniconductance mechanosensitive channel
MTIATSSVEKFWVIKLVENFLCGLDIPSEIAQTITFVMVCLTLMILAWIINLISTKILLKAVLKGVKHSSTKWDDFLEERKFFSRAIRLIPFIIILIFAKSILIGYTPDTVRICYVILWSILTFRIIRTICSFLDALNDVYESRMPDQTIKGYIQSCKVILYVIGGILIFMMIFDMNPEDLLVYLGATAAVITLVFKDTILGFVASIQLSAQDMVRKGDWIEIPSAGTDGVVTDINLNSVKVQNWDNTLSLIPIYKMVSEPFTNWRNMEESDGRRFKRPLMINILSVRALTQNEIEEINTHPWIAPLADTMQSLAKVNNYNPFITNLALYRNYIVAYLRANPNINEKLPISVRYLQSSENGLMLEIYAFTEDKSFVEYEKKVADVFDNLIASARIFHVELYQRPSAIRPEI